MEKVSVRLDRPTGQAGQMRPVEAAELERVEGGNVAIHFIRGYLVTQALVDAVVAVGKAVVNAVKGVIP